MQNYYETNTEEIMVALKVRISGLTSNEANLRLKKYGPNKLPEGKQKSYFQIFLYQFKSPLIYILFAAAIIVFFLQETTALVIRDGSQVLISDTDVVPGDIVVLEEGDKVPADLRIIKSNSLRVDEAALTGESEPVYKIPEIIGKSNLSIADQKNMAFRSTHVVAGNGMGIVIATGANTEIGKISKQIISVDDGSPLKSDIVFLSQLIIWAVLLISILLFIIGILQTKSPREMFTTVVALSVSIIPEGLPIVMTLVLAAGVWRMSKKKALVKKLQAVESLGQAKIIAVDKTGTITKNEMVVTKIYVSGQI